MTTYAKGFRLHIGHGRVLDGAQFPNGRVIVLDDPEWGLCSGARDVELLTLGYPGSRIEWPDDSGAEQPALVHPGISPQASTPPRADEPPQSPTA